MLIQETSSHAIANYRKNMWPPPSTVTTTALEALDTRDVILISKTLPTLQLKMLKITQSK